jgi:two-component system OmpR family response regulator
VVCDLADKLEIRAIKTLYQQRGMKRVIEADFFPQKSDAEFSNADSTANFAVKEKRRILIVDNDKNATRLVKMLLERTGAYVVLEENDATRAHQIARDFRPDLILLDIVMPEIDGGEVAAQIESVPELRTTPIIFLTALVTRAEAKNGLHIQGHPFLAKPISIPELISAIEENLPVHAAA